MKREITQPRSPGSNMAEQETQSEHDQPAEEAPPPAPRRPLPPMRWGRKALGIALIPGCWYLMQEASKRPEMVEEWYSTFAFPWIAAGLSKIAAPFSVSVGEVLVGAVLLIAGLKFLIGAARVLRARMGLFEGLMRGILNTASFAGTVVLLFTLLWGLNYHRQPFAEVSELSEYLKEETTPAELEELCDYLLAEAQEYRLKTIVADEEGKPRPLVTFDGKEGAIARSSNGFSELPMRYSTLAGEYSAPKLIYSSELFSYLGTWGIYSPFTGEANVNATIPHCALPFILCHEMAHQRGYAREDEANFIAFIACRHHRDGDFRYSGYLMALRYAMSAYAASDREAYFDWIGAARNPDGSLMAGKEFDRSKFGDAMLADFAQIEQWHQRWTIDLIRDNAQAINDAYLKANGDQDGIASYDRMVHLLLAEMRRMKAQP